MPRYRITVQGESYLVEIGRVTDDTIEVILDGRPYDVTLETESTRPKTPRLSRPRVVHDASSAPDRTAPPDQLERSRPGNVLAPLPGVVLRILVKEGERVTKGSTVAIMEAMKMENEIEANASGVVRAIAVSEGESILENALIMTISD